MEKYNLNASFEHLEQDTESDMKVLEFKKIDAFTKGVSPGNPAGYIFLTDGQVLTEEQMQRIARQLTGFVNEVGYVRRTGDEFSLKFYSAECEVAFCGHATIAIMYDILTNNIDLATKEEVFINVNAGQLSVFNHIDEDDAVYIMAPEPTVLECRLTFTQIAQYLGVSPATLDYSLPIKLIDGGLRTLIVPIKSLDDCLKVSPDQALLKSFCLDNGIDIIHVSTKETYTADCRYRTRVFAPKYGYLEDPATGSGNAAFGYYLFDQNLWEGDVVVEQGPDRINPNFVKLKKYHKNGKEHMLFGGCGTIRIEGRYYLQ